MPTKNSKENYTYNYRREFLINVWIFFFLMYTISASSRITELCFNSLSRKVIIYMGIAFS